MCILVTLVMYQLTMFLILVCKIPDMLATCALMFVHQGLGQWYIGGGAVSTGMRLPSGASPVRTKLEASFSAIGREPWLIIIMLACVLVAYIFLEYTKHGRFIYAMGGNKQAAKLSGINVKGYRYLAGMITAVFIAIGGILVSSRGSSAQVMCCDDYLMQSLAAVFVGRSVGGAEKPNALGTLIGAMLVSTLENGLTIWRRALLRAARREGRRAGPGLGRGLRYQEGSVTHFQSHAIGMRGKRPGEIRRGVSLQFLGLSLHQRILDLLEFLAADEHLAGLAAYGLAHDAARSHVVDQTARTGVADLHAALEHADAGLSIINHHVDGFQQAVIRAAFFVIVRQGPPAPSSLSMASITLGSKSTCECWAI